MYSMMICLQQSRVKVSTNNTSCVDMLTSASLKLSYTYSSLSQSYLSTCSILREVQAQIQLSHSWEELKLVVSSQTILFSSTYMYMYAYNLASSHLQEPYSTTKRRVGSLNHSSLTLLHLNRQSSIRNLRMSFGGLRFLRNLCNYNSA